MWMWALFVFLSWMHVGQAKLGLHYLVAVPAVLESGAQTKFCINILQLNESVAVNVNLISVGKTTNLFTLQTCVLDVHSCIDFKVPMVTNEELMDFVVHVDGNNFHSKETRKVLVKVYKPKTFIQTDKPIYLPGQKCHFRVVTLDTKLRPASQLYDVIEIEDPDTNMIGQWLKKNSDKEILELFYSLSSEAREGIYKIIVTMGEDKVYHSFKVEKYVLPRFDVTINVPEEVSVGLNKFKAKVCSMYTFDQPVPGSLTIDVCRPFMGHIDMSPEIRVEDPICYKETKEADKTGCVTFSIQMSTFTKTDSIAALDELTVSAEMEEEGTGVSLSREQKIRISYVLGKVSFIDTPSIYQQGTNVKGSVQALHYNDAPIPNKMVYLFIGSLWSPRSLQNVTTDRMGVASFTLYTADLKGDIELYASLTPTLDYTPFRAPYYERGHITLSMSQPSSPSDKTVSFLEVKKKDKPLPCDTEVEISVQYIITGEAQASVDLMCLVLARGAISEQKHTEIHVRSQSVNEGAVSFKFKVSPEMAPEVQIVAFAVLPSENVIAHSADFSTESCFTNKVSVNFVPSSAVPGETTNMQVTALPYSLCGVSAVDKSVLIKEPGKTLVAEKIFDLLPVRKANYVPYEVQDPMECMEVRPKRSILPFPDQEGNDAHSVFQNSGLKMATNLFIRLPSCLKYKGREYYNGYYGSGMKFGQVVRFDKLDRLPAAAAGAGEVAPELPPIETVRIFFPETWVWETMKVGESGKTDKSYTIPDTITTWESEAFCLSSEGFGLAPREEMKVFQPFFLEITMPYSIIRGEFFELKATIYSYLTNCMMVTVTTPRSSDYTVNPLSGDQYTSCLCPNERKTLSWSLTPTVLGVLNVTVSAEAVNSKALCNSGTVTVPERGRIDVVTKSVIVKPEGIEVTKNYNWILITKGKTLREEIVIQLPYNVIKGSAIAFVSVLGDILARALKNLNGLLQLPSGCGEQNMAGLTPIIYVYRYLKDSQQLTTAIEEKAISYMTSGYQNQLRYKHGDGSYSAFGTGNGNTWLTAFVVKSFTQAAKIIYIDPKVIEEATTWLKNQQRENGCFTKSGELFHKGMKGGVSDEVTLSAYICLTFLENEKYAKDPVVNKGLLCLNEYTKDLNNTYLAAMLAYVYTLAGDMKTRDGLLQYLDSVAKTDGGVLYWSQKSAETSASLSVEISSYVLLAILSAPTTAKDLGYAFRIVKYLIEQQNHYGGFSSTQDTVVALQALALYSTLVFSSKGSSKVTVYAPSCQLTFNVNQNNKLLYQEETIKEDVAGKYILEVKGSATVVVQISVRYNIPNHYDSETLSLEVEPEYEYSSPSSTPLLRLNIECLYTGKDSITNMMIVKIGLLSGYFPNSQSLKKLENATEVARVEEKQDSVLVYLHKLEKDKPIHLMLQLVEQFQVDNLKPAMVALFDLYEPGFQIVAEYFLPYYGSILSQQDEIAFLYDFHDD